MAAVVGAPDPKWGEIVVAAVTVRPGATVGEAELIAHCREYLSTFKVPKKIDFRDQMPMSSFGKILRRDVRKYYWQQQEVNV
jgi:acyl-CoA synthetase (AMP-forming)/AMP-acid ligase II